MASDFDAWDAAHGVVADHRDGEFPTLVRAWSAGAHDLPDEGTHAGVVQTGGARIEAVSGRFDLRAGMWFSVPGAARVEGDGAGVIVTALGWHGLFAVGGPIEPGGRLRYIDGCTDTLLVAPPRLGDPCLNALYFPPRTDQTAHTHPSLRAGIVMSGRGVCRVAGGDVPLVPGRAFVIPADARHAFATADEPMVVVAYHPDSDVGPTDESHPMITRTIVDGVPASRLATGAGS